MEEIRQRILQSLISEHVNNCCKMQTERVVTFEKRLYSAKTKVEALDVWQCQCPSNS